MALALIALPALGQEKKKAPAPKKQPLAAHKKATPEQIRRFNELQKK
jgi:hypothetical protein